MTAITVWIDESEVIYNNRHYWIIGQLITRSDGREFDFLKTIKEAHHLARTWDTLHSCEFNRSDSRKWDLLRKWLDAFVDDDGVYFHSYIFEKSTNWESNFATPHDYFAHQLFFGLSNKMKSEGTSIQTLFNDVDTVIAIMDRRSANSGLILQQEGSEEISIGRLNDLENIYEPRILRTLRHNSNRNVNLLFSFANSKCFDGLQLCDCLTYITRQKFVSEIQFDNQNIQTDFLGLFEEYFCDDNNRNLGDFGYYPKFNHFIGTNILPLS